MGSCVSSVTCEADARPDVVAEEYKRLNANCRPVKILLIGASDAGKTTVWNQMKILYQNGFQAHELAAYRPIVYQNLLDSIQPVLCYMKQTSRECEEYSNRALAEQVLRFRLDTSTTPHFPIEIAGAIYQLSGDDTIRKIIDEHTTKFYLMDSAGYFLNAVLRIGAPDYVPDETDVLRTRSKTQGVQEARFSMGNLAIHMFDLGGQRSERRKWIHCFKSVTSIIFCTALSEYDQVLLEEKTQNRMAESLLLFEAFINSKWFIQTSFILFLNKTDVFENKLPKVPLEPFFPKYTGGSDSNKAAKFILWNFMAMNRTRLKVYPHLTCAISTNSVRLSFTAVKETALQHSLKHSDPL